MYKKMSIKFMIKFWIIISQKCSEQIIFNIKNLLSDLKMLSKLSFHHKKSQNKLNDHIHAHQNKQQTQKENNQQSLNLNLVRKSLNKSHDFDILSTISSRVDKKNYFTNHQNKLNIPLTYISNQIPEVKVKIHPKNDQKNQRPPLKQIYQSNTQQFYDLYGKDILAHHELMPIRKLDFLKNHQIDAALRARMLDWMVEVTKSYKFINKSYFASVQLLDRYFTQCKQSIPVTQLHILGVISMYIASKMQEIYPLKIKTIYEKIVHKKMSRQVIIETQMNMFDVLKYKVNSWTFFDLTLLKIADTIANQNVDLKSKVQQVISFVSKCILYDYQLYLKYDMETLAKVLVKIVSRICNLIYKNEPYSVSCHEDISRSYRKFKTTFKGLNNIFKFSDPKIVQIVDEYFFEDPKNNKTQR